MLEPLRQGEFSLKIGKISVYVQSAARARDAKSLGNFVRFAQLNLDDVLVAALEAVVWRPRLASKADEQKKAVALQKTFDRLENPAQGHAGALSEQLRSA